MFKRILTVDSDATEGKNDIAIVQLKEAVSYGPNIQEIKLNSDSNYPQDGTICKAQGWGCTSNSKFHIYSTYEMHLMLLITLKRAFFIDCHYFFHEL